MAAIVFHVGKELGLLALGKLESVAKEKLGSMVTEKYSLLVGVQNEAKELAPTLALIKAVVQDAEIKQTDSKAVELWLGTLKEIMYDADDLLDEWYTRIAISQLESTDASSSSSASASASGSAFEERSTRIAIPQLESTDASASAFDEWFTRIAIPQLESIDASASASASASGSVSAFDEWSTRIAIPQLESTDASSSSSASASASGTGSVSAITNKVFSFLTSKCSCFEPIFLLLFGDNSPPIVVRYDIALKIKGIRARLDKQYSEINQLGLIPSQSHEVHMPSQPSTNRRLTTSMDVYKIYGRETDKDVIVSRLLGETGSSEQQEMVHVPVISIVGTGGFGKTTLAQLIYKQDTIMTTFKVRIWVCVSDPFNLERVVKEIIQQAGKSASNVFGLEALLERLRASVKDKRFLLVLDDVWSEDDKNWIRLKHSLDAGAPGSRVLITTRNVRVANRMGSTNPHMLGPLTEADCWLLFHNRALLGRPDKETEKLESIGRELARKCQGVPLAVKTLASSMSFKKKIEEWRAVLESDTWRVLQQDEDGLRPSLMFSYQALTPSLKLCFLYCAVFPKDYRMEKDELVKQWMAQGFLESDEGDELEMIGAENFDILAMRSLFQDFEEDSDGNIVACSMHDLVHDFCRFLANNPVLHIKVSDLNDMDNSSNVIGKKIRTLVCEESIPYQVFDQFTWLRTLVMRDCGIQVLPGDVVGRLLHLRYLDLSHNEGLRELPETVCNLLNLQTLNLVDCSSLCKLPERIGKLRNLRHLEIKGTAELKYFPHSIGKLRNLRTLSNFGVSGIGGGCGIGELRHLNHLRGTLRLIGLWHVHNSDEAKRTKLHEKRNLNCLKFGNMWDVPEDEVEIERMEDVFESLRPNVNLEKLKINYYLGSKLPSWIVSPLSKLVTLKLNACYNCQTLPGLGDLQFLETLRLQFLFSIKHIGAEFYGVGVVTSFPKLKTLEFMNMDELETWEIPFPKYEKVMPRLQSLVVNLCGRLIKLPSLGRLESLETIEILGSPLVKVGTELFGMSSDSSGKECNKNITSSGGGDYVKQPTAVKHVSAHLLGNSDGESTASASSSSVVLFPRLTCLKLLVLPLWEEGEDTMDNDAGPITASIMPCLRILSINGCPKLKMVPHYMFSQSLRTLELRDCPQLTGKQHCLPPLLEEISFNENVGVLSTSLLPVISHHNNTTTYPNLKIVRIGKSPHFSLPEGLDQLTSLEKLFIRDCDTLDFKLEELPHLPMLKKLKISRCPLITERCRGEDWISIFTRPNALRNHLSTA